jgi:hypothetical protein
MNVFHRPIKADVMKVSAMGFMARIFNLALSKTSSNLYDRSTARLSPSNTNMRCFSFVYCMCSIAMFSIAAIGHAREVDDHQAEMEKVTNLYNRADRTLKCDREFKFTMGIGRVEGTPEHRVQDLIEFNIADIDPLLVAERHKDILLVVCDGGITMENADVITGYVTKLNKMFKVYSYKRVVILGEAGSGNYILSDTATKPVDQKHSPSKAKRG